MDIKINIDCTHYVPLLASPVNVVPQVDSVRIADAPTMGGAAGVDAEFTRSGPLLWSPPV